MSATFQLDTEKLAELRIFVTLLEENPDAIHAPELAFFRDFMKKYGATIPSGSHKSSTEKKTQQTFESSKQEDPEEVVSDDEPDSEDEDISAEADKEEDAYRMEPEPEGAPAPIEENTKELTDEQQERVASLKSKVAEATEDKDYNAGLEYMTEILKLANPSAMLYAKRAELNFRLKRPLAAIQDCNSALRLNPDNGKAYRLRGRAYRALGDWEKAHEDLEIGQKIDYDDELYEEQKYVAQKWKAIDERRRAKLRRREERARRNLLRERRRRQAAARRAYAAQHAQNYADTFNDLDEDDDSPDASSFPGSMPSQFNTGAGAGADGGLGGLGGLLGGLMGNPEMKKAMNNPKVLQAVMELMQNPASFSKYQNDPQVMSAFSSIMGSMKGAAGPGAEGCCGGGAGQCGPTGCGK